VLRLFQRGQRSGTRRSSWRARAFIVRASVKAGEVGRVEIDSQAGGVCRLRNPWGADAAVTVRRRGGASETFRGSLIELASLKGDTLVLEKAAGPGHEKVLDGRPPSGVRSARYFIAKAVRYSALVT